jgi:tRNA C32,U32 (ribose-2'-O)-methylase TrmJ
MAVEKKSSDRLDEMRLRKGEAQESGGSVRVQQQHSKGKLTARERIALLLGNEKDGLSETAMALADRRLTIPMRGIAQSMNVSVSAALLLYEITRQRHARGSSDYLVDEAGAQRVFDYFMQMHESLGKTNKRLRVERAKARKQRTFKSN